MQYYICYLELLCGSRDCVNEAIRFYVFEKKEKLGTAGGSSGREKTLQRKDFPPLLVKPKYMEPRRKLFSYVCVKLKSDIDLT